MVVPPNCIAAGLVCPFPFFTQKCGKEPINDTIRSVRHLAKEGSDYPEASEPFPAPFARMRHDEFTKKRILWMFNNYAAVLKPTDLLPGRPYLKVQTTAAGSVITLTAAATRKRAPAKPYCPTALLWTQEKMSNSGM